MSLTMNVVMQLDELLLASVAVTVIVCGPSGRSVPATGDCVRVGLMSQLSWTVAAAVKSGTAAMQLAFASAD